ncbi:hypothetical protein V1477_006363 [Vespula maculifrons]|uniref:Uncharacterized protein n=1 Tax=Vespula maculifrons TaxID=7453 RepID=A0ABD2CK67_VESMC
MELIGADTYENRTLIIGKDSSRTLRPHFFRPDGTNRSRVITHLEEPDRGRLKELVASSTRIFFTYRSDQQEPSYNGLQGSKEKKNYSLTIFFLRNYSTYENRTLINGKDTSGPLRPHFFRPDRTNRSRAITHLGEPNGGHWKGLVASSSHIFFTTYENRTLIIGKDSSRPLRPHFFRPDRTNRSRAITHLREQDLDHWKGHVAPSTPTFFCPERTNRSRAITFKENKGKKHFSLTIFFSETIVPWRTGPGSFERARRVLYAHILNVQIRPTGADTYENRTLIIGKGSSRPLRAYFFRPDGSNRCRVISHLGEPDRGRLKELVASSTSIFFMYRSDQQEPSYNGLQGTKEKKNYSLTIFFLRNYSTYENRTLINGKDTSGPLRPHFFRPDRTNRSRAITHLGEPNGGHWKGLVASSTHIFFTTYENRTLIIGKDTSLPLRPHFFRPDRTNRSRAITHLEEPDRGRLKELVASSTRIFFTYRSDQQEPSYNGLQGSKEKKNYSLTIFFLRNYSTYENRTLINGKDTSGPLRPHFFRPDRTNRSRFITLLGEPDRGRLKGSSRLLLPYFLRTDRTNRSRVITNLGEPDRGRLKELVASSTRIFLRTDRTNRSRVITHLREPDLDHWKGPVAPSTPIFFAIFFSETIAPRRTRPGSFKGLVAPSTPIFFAYRSDQ